MSEKSEPRILEVNVNVHGGGKVAIDEYGKEVADYGTSFSRRYAIPDGMSDAEVTDFEINVYDELRTQVDDLNQVEYDAAMQSRKF